MESPLSPVESPMESPGESPGMPGASRTRRKSIGPGKEPEFEDPYDTRWQQQFDAAPIRPYKTKDEYLYAMREDLADWLNDLYKIDITTENFFEKLETGCILCQHANNVRRVAIEYKQTQASTEDPDDGFIIEHAEIRYKPDAKQETFLARDNISNFIHWCRHCLNIKDVLLFETDDLVLRKNIKSFILCLLEVARRGGKIGMPVPMLVQFEKEIEMELRNSCMNLSGMSSIPSEKSDSISTGPPSPSSSATTTDIEPESPSSGAELDLSLTDSAPFMSPLGRVSSDSSLPPIRKDSRSKSLPRPRNLPRDALHRPTPPPLRRNNSLRRPRQLPCIPPKPSKPANVNVRGTDSWLARRLKNQVSPNRHSLPSALEDLQPDDDFDEDEPWVQIMLQPAILKSLDERVRDLVNRCTCPAQFPMIREAEGKYRIGEACTLIFVRILRNHVMVRVGGGWDTLEHYLDKHDPCRCQLHKKKKPHHRAHSQPAVPMRRSQSPVLRAQSPVQRSQSPVQRVRRLSGGGMRHSWGNRSLDASTLGDYYERPVTPESPSSSKSMIWRRTDSIETASMDSQMSADLTKTEIKLNFEDDELVTSPASDLSPVERLIEDESNRRTEKVVESPMDEDNRPALPIPKRPSRLSTTSTSDKTATEHLLRRRRSSEATAHGKAKLSSTNQTKSAPTSPKRSSSGATFSTVNIIASDKSPVHSGDVWRRFAIAGARDSSSPSLDRRARSASAKENRINRERSESPLTRNRSLTPSATKRKSRPHSARLSHERESRKENSNVLMITRDSEGRHRLDSTSSCESNDSRSVDGASSGRRTPTDNGRRTPTDNGRRTPDYGRRTPDNGRRTPDNGRRTPDYGRRTPTDNGRRTPDYGRRTPTDNGRRTPDYGRLTPIDNGRRTPTDYGRRTPTDYGRRTPTDRSKPSQAKSVVHGNESAATTNRRSLSSGREGTRSQSSERLRCRSAEPIHLTEHHQRPSSVGPRKSYGSPSVTRRRRTTIHTDNLEHTDAISRSLQDYRRKLPTPPGEFTRKSTSSAVWRRTTDKIDDDFRSSLEARLGSSAYPRSRSGNSSPVTTRTHQRSRLRPVTPVPRHMKVDSHIVTPMRKDTDHNVPTKIPMPVQHKRILDGSRDVRTRSLPDLIDLPRWLVRRIELDSNDCDTFDCSQSLCSSMSVSPTPSVKAENPNDSGYEDNSAAKTSPLSTLSFADDASPPDTTVELPGQEVEASAASALSGLDEDK